VLETIGTNDDLSTSSDDSMMSVDFRKFFAEYEEEFNSKAAEEGEAMDEGSRENSSKELDDMDLEDNPDVQMSESTDQSMALGNGPKAIFATGGAKSAKKKKTSERPSSRGGNRRRLRGRLGWSSNSKRAKNYPGGWKHGYPWCP